jgi:hypothetical protein
MLNPLHQANFWRPQSLTGVGGRFRFRAKLINLEA